MKNRFPSVLSDCLRKNRVAVLFFAIVNALNLTVFILYRLKPEPFFYALAISGAVLILLLFIDFLRELRFARRRESAIFSILSDWNSLPEPQTLADADYSEMLRRLGNEAMRKAAEFDAERRDTLDYYTAWVHQIKTPIAVMKMSVNPESPEGRELSDELFRVEQYVEMVLAYIRLGSDTNDLVIREYRLDDLIKDSIHKYAHRFIRKKIKLEYLPTDAVAVTDEKWFCTILEQFISNAVKYTRTGCVTITATAESVSVSDTGIGIAPEDLPRIFEKGYTGVNGRIGEASSGLGLYLAKRAADKLSLTLTAESKLSKGSTFTIGLKNGKRGE